MKVLTIHDLKIIKKRAEGTLLLREESNETVATQCCGLALGTEHLQILICGGTGCKASDSHIIAERLQQALERNNIADKVDIITTGCFGFCEKGPIVKIIPDNTFYTQVVPDDADEIVREHIIGGRKIERLLYIDPKTEKTVSDSKHMDFYRKQMRIALRNCGFIDPENIEEYIALDGYMALADSLLHKKPEEVIDVIKRSGLRGRGGGGFPTGRKWQFAAAQKSEEKFIICNADEGDPGAFMDRAVLEGDPHTVLEAMAIGGYAIGAHTGVIYIRAEYPLAVKRLEIAIRQAEELGLLGRNIFDSGFDFRIEIKYGAGAFVCGEETALIHSIEGKRGEPTVKPPFPAVEGLWKKPTVVNNVETYACIGAIVRKGSEWFRSLGTAGSPGTKVFALAGKVAKVGLVEVPMGTTLRDIVFGIGGGIKNGRAFKAVQTGGPSGGCITPANLDLPIDYEALKSIGSMMGSGGMIVMDEDDCMVNIAKFFLEFTLDESCGKCTPCRIGNRRMYEMLNEITEGRASLDVIDRLKTLSATIKDTALCGLGQTSPNPVLSTLANFEDEYLAHVKESRCPAGVCAKLIRYEISDRCVGCGLCLHRCPVNCISGERKMRHRIDQSRCIKCGVCFQTCKFHAVEKH